MSSYSDMPRWYEVPLRAATLLCSMLSRTSFLIAGGMALDLQAIGGLLASSTTQELVSRQAQGVFINPAGDPLSTDFSNNQVFVLNTVVEIEWDMDIQASDEISLFLSVGINTSYAPVPQAIESKVSGKTFKWTVVNAFGALSQMFQLSLRTSNETILFSSRIFNVSITEEITNSSPISPDTQASSAHVVPSVAATSSKVSPVTSGIVFIPSGAPIEISTSKIPTSLPVTTSSQTPFPKISSPTQRTTQPIASPTRTTSSTSSTSDPNTLSFPVLGLTTMLISTTSRPSATATALASNTSDNMSIINGQAKAEIALGVVLAIMSTAIATYYISRYMKTHPKIFSFRSKPRAPSPIEETEKAPIEVENIHNIPAELAGVPLHPAELYGDSRSPVELDDGLPRPKSMVARWQHGIVKTISCNCPWRRSR